MQRRDFIKAGLLAGGALTAGRTAVTAAGSVKNAADIITLGPDKIRLSRLAMGTGPMAMAEGRTRRGTRAQGNGDLLQAGYDNGVSFRDCADEYGTHEHVKEALKGVPREKVSSSPRRTRAPPRK